MKCIIKLHWHCIWPCIRGGKLRGKWIQVEMLLHWLRRYSRLVIIIWIRADTCGSFWMYSLSGVCTWDYMKEDPEIEDGWEWKTSGESLGWWIESSLTFSGASFACSVHCTIFLVKSLILSLCLVYQSLATLWSIVQQYSNTSLKLLHGATKFAELVFNDIHIFFDAYQIQ